MRRSACLFKQLCSNYGQRGGAIQGFAGQEWQRGSGFGFGRFLWRHAKPLLGYLAKQGLKTGVEIGRDVLEGKQAKSAALSRLKETGKTIAQSTIDKAQKKIDSIGQGGSGLKKRRKRKRKHIKRKMIRSKKTFKKKSVRGRKKKKVKRKSTKRKGRKRSSLRTKKRLRDIFDA